MARTDEERFRVQWIRLKRESEERDKIKAANERRRIGELIKRRVKKPRFYWKKVNGWRKVIWPEQYRI